MIGGLLVLLVYFPIILFIFDKKFRKKFNREHAESKLLIFVEILNGALYFLMIYLAFNVNLKIDYLFYLGVFIYFPSLFLVYRGYSLYFEEQGLIKKLPFNISRNPTYFFGLLAVFGVSLMNNSFILGGVVIIQFFLVHLVILREEEYLEKEYGKEYLDYKKRVRRYV